VLRHLTSLPQWQEGFGRVRQSHIFSPSSAHSSALHLAVSSFTSALPFANAVLVFSNGYWSLDNDLFAAVQQASWKDVILDAKLKNRIQEEYRSFLRSEEVYKGLGVPWKRGLMFLGVSSCLPSVPDFGFQRERRKGARRELTIAFNFVAARKRQDHLDQSNHEGFRCSFSLRQVLSS
jgi:hypothetical protein